ncbi:MAG: hypothetical protein IKL87_05995 [Oscillospiraceae bacterium]|nr:hypothetical protein [Oscillospiraceae bacterium]
MKRKKLKGLSLMEIIISIAVYAIIALLMAEIMGCINATMTSTSRLNERLDSEALLVDNKDTNPGSTPYRNPNRVNVIAHIENNSSAGLALDQGTELIPATSSEPGRIEFGDNQNSTHFRFMSFTNRNLNITLDPNARFTFKIKLTQNLDDASFAALPGNAARKVIGIDKVVVSSTAGMIDDADNIVNTPREFTGAELINRNAGDDFITLQLPYDQLNDRVVVTVDIYPIFESGVVFNDPAADTRYIRNARLDFVQFMETGGSENQTYRYFDAIYEFDGQGFTPCTSSQRPVLVPDGT